MTESNLKRSTEQTKSIILATISVLVGIIVIVFGDSAYFVNAQEQNITKTGIFNYTHSDILDDTDWIITGNWSLTESPSVVFTFDAIMNIAKSDSSEAFEYRVSDLTIPYAPIIQSNSTVMHGTTTITMDDGFFISEVPTTIALKNELFSVNFDFDKIDNRLGNLSVRSIVT